jgi:hypothetical protein
MKLVARDLGDQVLEAHHAERHAIYKPDDNARDVAVTVARRRYPAANHAAERVVIHDLHRPGAHELPTSSAVDLAAAGDAGSIAGPPGPTPPVEARP